TGTRAPLRLASSSTSQVLAHPVNGKPEVKAPLDHGAATVDHLPALGGALVDHVEHLAHVKSGCLAKRDPSGKGLYQTGDADLVDHFCELAGAGFAQQCHG